MPDPAAPARTILVIDDDLDLREVIADTLESAGHHVVKAVDGQDGLRQLRAHRPDAIVLDLVMPALDGWQFRIEQKRDPALASTPVIAMSASPSATAAAIDADLYLRKPFEVAQIIVAVESVLRASERRRAAINLAQTERLISLGTLAAGIAHEINNPLTYVLMNLSGAVRHLGALDGPAVEHVREMLHDALDGSERIREIVHAMRAFARPEAPAAGAIEVRPCVEAALRFVASDLRVRAKLVTSYRETPKVVAQEARLSQVFLNLIANAVQAIAPADPDRNEIRVTTGTDADGRALVEIADTGCGIPPHLLARIFDPFFTTKPVGDGTGLGLSITSGIVRDLGGEISVESAIGQGSTFRVTLPAARDEATAAHDGGARRLRILLVDDEPAICKSLARALGADYEIAIASSAEEALERLTAGGRFDFVLSDVRMRGMSGVDLYHAVRARCGDKAPRMTLMTGGALTEEVQAQLDTDEVVVLGKPLDIGKLRSMILDHTS